VKEQHAGLAVDGDTKTSWASPAGKDEEWFRVDLGYVKRVCAVKITWDVAMAKKFLIKVGDFVSFKCLSDGFLPHLAASALSYIDCAAHC
jgi:hypothetical protein